MVVSYMGEQVFSVNGDWEKKIDGDLYQKKVGDLVILRRCGDGDLPQKVWRFGDFDHKIFDIPIYLRKWNGLLVHIVLTWIVWIEFCCFVGFFKKGFAFDAQA